ncbi:MAG: hypothetical protein SFU87_12835 [Chitinophagaceae bacterium]|nr:hypothetical protein [Chitinophagaceae bacterium]
MAWSWQWLSSTVNPLQQLIGFLHRKSETNDVLKKQIIIELRDNLNVFRNGFINQVSYDKIIDLLGNDAYRNAIKQNFNFKKLKEGKLEAKHIHDERNKRYMGWTAEKLMDKIDEKIQEMKNIKKMNGGSVEKIKNNIAIKLSNLYFRIKLMADFIYGK